MRSFSRTEADQSAPSQSILGNGSLLLSTTGVVAPRSTGGSAPWLSRRCQPPAELNPRARESVSTFQLVEQGLERAMLVLAVGRIAAAFERLPFFFYGQIVQPVLILGGVEQGVDQLCFLRQVHRSALPRASTRNCVQVISKILLGAQALSAATTASER